MKLTRRSFLGMALSAPLICGRRLRAAVPLRGDLRVLVIGAGAAGLGAARQLSQMGLKVTVLEARARIGGRISTNRDAFGSPVEAGANFIHGVSRSGGGEMNPIYALASQQGWNTALFSADEAQFRFSGSALSPEELGELFDLYADFEDYAINQSLDADLETPLGTAIESYISLNGLDAIEEAALRAMLTFLVGQAYGADPAGMSLRYFERDDVYAEGGDLVLPEGYDQLPDFLAQGLDIRTDEQVERIDYSDPVVRVATNRTEHQAEFVLVTVPLGVLQAGELGFTPALPAAKQAAINRLQMGVQNKVFLRFPNRFWPEGVTWFAQIETSAPYGLVFSNFAELGANLPVVAAWHVGSTAAVKESLSDAQIISDARSDLQRIFPEAAVPEPVASLVTRWNSDPFSRGSYPHVPAGGSFDDMDSLAEPVAGRLFFAGDATHSRFYGTVHGAYMSGLRETDRIAREAARLSHRLAIRKSSPGAVEVSWESDSAFTYQLEKSTGLPVWTAHGGQIAGAGSRISTTNSVSDGSTVFFRLRVE